MTTWLTEDDEANALLDRDPLALLIGMLLDQQFPMERAFAGPQLLAERLGVDRFDAAAVAALDPDELTALCVGPPAVHRYPASMATRIQGVCAHVATELGGDVTRLWTEASTGAELLARLKALPGFGDQKAPIFLALLGKQRGLDLPGWQEAAGAYGEPGRRSVADVTDATSLLEVRATKQQAKAAAKAAKAANASGTPRA